MLLIALTGQIKVCVKDEGGNPIYGAYVKTNIDWGLTGGDGCAEVKGGDSLYVSRIGYLPYRGPFKGEVVLISSPVKLHPVEVKVNAISPEKGNFYQPYSIEEVGVSAYGTSALSKLNIRGFDRKRYEVFFEGFLISDQSGSEDHPMGALPTNENVGIIKGSSSGIFGGNSMGGAVIIEGERPYGGFKPGFNLNIGNLGLYTDLNLSKGGDFGFDILGGFKGFGNYVENSWDTAFFGKLKLFYGNFQAGAYSKFQRYGIPLEDARSQNLFITTFLKFEPFGFSYQLSDQREFEHEHHEHSLLHEERTVLREESFQLVLSRDINRFGIYSRAWYGKFHTGDILKYLFTSLRYSILEREDLHLMGGINLQFGDHPFLYGFLLVGDYHFENFKTSISLSKSYRIPDLYEKFFTGYHHALGRYDIGNPNLKPEESYEIQISLSANLKNLTLSINPYYNRVFNYIYPKQIIADTFRWENKNYADISGVEFESNVIFGKNILKFGAYYPMLNVPISNVPKPEAFISAEFSLFSFKFSPYYRWNSAGFQVINLSISTSWRFLNLSFGINNLLNEVYIEPTSPRPIPQPGRVYFLNLTL
jgi:outer membrane receptor protein involved in Fe transport